MVGAGRLKEPAAHRVRLRGGLLEAKRAYLVVRGRKSW